MNRETDERFMRLAIEKTREGIKAGQSPFGACLVRDGEILATTLGPARLGRCHRRVALGSRLWAGRLQRRFEGTDDRHRHHVVRHHHPGRRRDHPVRPHPILIDGP